MLTPVPLTDLSVTAVEIRDFLLSAEQTTTVNYSPGNP